MKAVIWVHSKNEQNRHRAFLTEWQNTGSGAAFGLILNPHCQLQSLITEHRGSICIFICYFWEAGANRRELWAQMAAVIVLWIAGDTDASRRLVWAFRRFVVSLLCHVIQLKVLLNRIGPNQPLHDFHLCTFPSWEEALCLQNAVASATWFFFQCFFCCCHI